MLDFKLEEEDRISVFLFFLVADNVIFFLSNTFT